MAFLRLAPWTSVSSQRGSLDGEGTEEVGRSFSRRGEAPAAWDRWGRGTRRSSRTCWWPWLAKRWSEAAPPRAPVAGGDGARRQRHSGGKGWRAWADELHWDLRIPFPGSVEAEEGRRWELHGKRAAGGALCRGDGLPAAIERGGRVWEGHWEAVVVLGYSVWGKRG